MTDKKSPEVVTNTQMVKWLKVALAQRKRAITKFEVDYGGNSPAAQMLKEELTQLETEILRLEKLAK